MTEADLALIIEACRPVPAIMLQIPGGRGPQERANDAWQALGEKMGFDHMTVQPTGQGDRFFSAVPSETPEQRSRRIKESAETARRQEIETLESEISERQAHIAKLKEADQNPKL